MNVRTTLILAVILIVLAGVATLMETQRKKKWSPQGGLLFSEYAKDAVDEIEITKSEHEVRLTKRDGKWLVATEDDKPAEMKSVNDILDKFAGLKSDDLVSTKADSHAALEVDTTGVELEMKQGGKTTLHAVVGKPGPDFMSTYIRPHGQDDVYRVPAYLKTLIDRGDQTWRNKTILEIPEADVAGWTAKTDTLTVALERKDDGWYLTEPVQKKAREDVMSVVVRTVAQIRASGFADTTTATAAGLDHPTKVLDIRTKGGSSYTIEIGGENPQRQSYTRLKGEDTIYLVPLGRWNTIFRKTSELEDTAAVPPGTPAVPAGAGGQ